MNKVPMRAYLYCRVATEEQLDGDYVLNPQSARLHEQTERQEYLDSFPIQTGCVSEKSPEPDDK